ncbi:hypothetical protein IAG44_13450 [Streptomyces roseirectus]|uniref:Uncharacterized protein n=1 Tax=Streptomyces roseirectus TaxID=2768066 RepID=A0A7H0IC37_9ACTN|nr:hypothetical protein [Streptomyces roseirectus]QNP70353.1 hypothetical protein IAG44_13450 [Streptomyces roseirectus]
MLSARPNTPATRTHACRAAIPGGAPAPARADRAPAPTRRPYARPALPAAPRPGVAHGPVRATGRKTLPRPPHGHPSPSYGRAGVGRVLAAGRRAALAYGPRRPSPTRAASASQHPVAGNRTTPEGETR